MKKILILMVCSLSLSSYADEAELLRRIEKLEKEVAELRGEKLVPEVKSVKKENVYECSLESKKEVFRSASESRMQAISDTLKGCLQKLGSIHCEREAVSCVRKKI